MPSALSTLSGVAGKPSTHTPIALWTAGPISAGTHGSHVLADADGAVRSVAHPRFHQDGVDLADIHQSGDLVVQEVAIEHDAGPLVIHHLFGAAPADSHVGPTVRLAFAAVPVDHLADVVDRDHFRDVDLAGLGIDLDLHEVSLPAEAHSHPQVGPALDLPGVLEQGGVSRMG